MEDGINFEECCDEKDSRDQNVKGQTRIEGNDNVVFEEKV